MRLLTFRTGDGAGERARFAVGRVDGPLDAHGDPSPDAVVVEVAAPPGAVHPGAAGWTVGDLLAAGGLDHAATQDGPEHRFGDLDLAPVVPRPSKVLCVGLNYAKHIAEMGRDLPEHPTLFAKFPDTLTGPYDDVAAPGEDEALDWEGELTIVIGRTCRRIGTEQAAEAIAGYTVANDVSMRTWQFRTKEWLQGKAWEASTPVGPFLVTTDEWQPGSQLTVDVGPGSGGTGERMQEHATSDLVFGPSELVAYASTMTTLRPGDLILTGTPGGVGRARTPARFLRVGETLTTSVAGLGTLRNRIVADPDTEPYLAAAGEAPRPLLGDRSPVAAG